MSAPDTNKPSETNWDRVDLLRDEEIDASDLAPLDESFFARAKLRAPGEQATADDLVRGVQRQALELLAEVWSLSPDVRLGQLLAHLGFLSEAHVGKGLGYVEDDELISILHRHQAELQARLESGVGRRRATK